MSDLNRRALLVGSAALLSVGLPAAALTAEEPVMVDLEPVGKEPKDLLFEFAPSNDWRKKYTLVLKHKRYVFGDGITADVSRISGESYAMCIRDSGNIYYHAGSIYNESFLRATGMMHDDMAKKCYRNHTGKDADAVSMEVTTIAFEIRERSHTDDLNAAVDLV